MTENTEFLKKELSLSPVHIDTIQDRDFIPFNLYTFESGRYFLYCRSHQPVKKDFLSSLYVSGKKYFYIEDSDKPNYKLYLEKNLKTILHNKEITTDFKVDMLYDLSSAMITQMFKDRRALSELRISSFIKDTTDFIFDEELKIKQLIKKLDHIPQESLHSFHVYIYTTIFLRFIDIWDRDLVKKICMGAFLHDIGKSRIAPELLTDEQHLSNDEIAELHRHPYYGVDIIKNEMGIRDKVIESIVLNHHERLDGSGFPRGIKDLETFETIISITDTYDTLTTKKPYQRAKTPYEALHEMVHKQSKALDFVHLKKFTMMLGEK